MILYRNFTAREKDGYEVFDPVGGLWVKFCFSLPCPKWLAAILFLLLLAVQASAQTVAGDRFRLNAGPCFARSGSGSPEGSVVGNTCDTYLRIDTGAYFLKLTGTGTNTGWMQFSSTISTPLAMNLILAPTGDIVTNPAGKDILPGTPYDTNIGMLSNKYLALYAGELWVETLVAQNTVATIGGRVLIAPTNILTLDLAPATTTISVKYNNLVNGDRVYLEAGGNVEFMAVASTASGTGPYTYTVTRNLDGSGANQWYAGDAILDTGTTGNGFIDLYSTAGILGSGSGPSIVGNVRTGTAYNAYAPRWAIGNLNGVYGYASSIYGSAFGDSGATNVTVDATNGFRIRSGTTNKLVADTAGNLAITGDLTVGTAGIIRSAGATNLTTGTGFYIAGGTTPTFRVGNPAGNRLSWDGTTLTIAAEGSGITNIDGGNIQTSTITASKINVTSLSAISANIGTITAGSISGVSITAGGGVVTLNSGGLAFSTGQFTERQVNWSDGSAIGVASVMYLLSQQSAIHLIYSGSPRVTISSGGMLSDSGISLGSTSARWGNLYLSGSVDALDSITFSGQIRGLGGLYSGTGVDYVCIDSNGVMFRQNAAC